MDHEWQVKGKSESPRDASREPPQRREWRNIKDYTFNIGDTERWFDVLKSKGKITPWIPKNLPKPEDEKKENFCRFHQRLGHPTMRCRDVMEKIQELLDKGDIKYKTSAANVMTVSHLSSLMKSHKGKEKQGEEMDSSIVNAEDTKVSSTSTKEVKKVCSTPPSMQKFEVQTDQRAKLCEEKKLKTQEEVKSKNSRKYGKTRLRLMCSYIGGNTRLVAVERDCSYSSLVDRIRSTFSTSSPFMIKCQ